MRWESSPEPEDREGEPCRGTDAIDLADELRSILGQLTDDQKALFVFQANGVRDAGTASALGTTPNALRQRRMAIRRERAA